jgi:DNA alkylation damage repair protein AlkB
MMTRKPADRNIHASDIVAVPLPAGAFHLLRWLPLDAQRVLVDECRALIDGAVPAYVPVLRSGWKMRVRMLCLGRHWNPKTSRYESTRTDFDGLPAPPLPESWKTLARDIAASVDMPFEPDLCILNYYERAGSLGLHQDKDEDKRSIAAGVPVVSVSIGDTARFLFGGLRRNDEAATIPLESGDAFVFGGPARLCYHGVSRIMRGTAPPELQLAGRFNLTFRQYEIAPSRCWCGGSCECRMDPDEVRRDLGLPQL